MLDAAGVAENVLGPHCEQEAAASAEKEPALHAWHVRCVFAPTTDDAVPAAQLVHVEAPPSANDPASHSMTSTWSPVFDEIADAAGTEFWRRFGFNTEGSSG